MKVRLPADVSDLIGLPYKTHGRGESGVDCFGLILLIARRNGTPIADVWYKGFDPSLIKLADQMNVERCELEPGCVIETVKGGRLHLGYALDGGRMIHATINEGVIVESINKYPVKGCYRFKGK
jgi:cell wall-associated NlpC family hydrolase